MADDYEPPPHVGARLWNPVRGLIKRAFRQPTRWEYVAQSLFLAVLYVRFSPWLAVHLPLRFNGASYWIYQMQRALYYWAKHDPSQFARLATFFGLYTVVVGPLFEELTCRGLSILAGRAILRRSNTVFARLAVFVIAAFSCLLFAWLHFRSWSVFPVPQFLFGVAAWPIAWYRGLRYSILLHMTTNLLFFGVIMAWVMQSR